jgi:hypothetical protein
VSAPDDSLLLRKASGATEFEYAVRLPAWIETGRTSRTCLMAVGIVKTVPADQTTGELVVTCERGTLGPCNMSARLQATSGHLVAEAPLEIIRRE